MRRSISTGQGKITPRLITLDDENFAPQGTNWTPLLVGLPGSAIILVGPVLAAIWFDANAEILFGFAENSVDAENVKRAMRTFIMSIGICLLPWLTFRMLVLVWSEHAKRTSVEVESDINNITRTLMADRSEWQTFRAMHIPRSRVVTTSHQLWKSAVKQLASSCDLIVIDVSSDSESIRWEIELITEHHLSRSLVLCNSASALPEQFSSGSSVYFYSSKMQIVDIVQQAMSEKNATILSSKEFTEFDASRVLDWLACLAVPSILVILGIEGSPDLDLALFTVQLLFAVAVASICIFSNRSLSRLLGKWDRVRRLLLLIIGAVVVVVLYTIPISILG